MAASFGSAAAAASVSENAHKSSNYLPLCQRHFILRSSSNRVFFRLSPRPKLRFSSKGFQSGWNCSAVVKAQLNQVAADGSSKAAASTSSGSEGSKAQVQDVKLASEESIAEFITQVSSLVKLVDSKDIIELQLKQLDCELLIRKKEALSPSRSPPTVYVESLPHPVAPVLTPPAPIAAPPPSSTPAPSLTPSQPKAAQSKSSHPPLKCPMAGTFYRSPGPGEPPFVKVGDKVKKGQVVCIIEAMKLMNEIEADQSGTVVEILVEDGKPVSVDMPLFVIEP